MTTTIEATFGSRIMVRGFLLNNQLTDFDFTPGGAERRSAPRKRPRSSMAPTMVFSGERLDMALGSPGGPTIINYVAKTLVGDARLAARPAGGDRAAELRLAQRADADRAGQPLRGAERGPALRAAMRSRSAMLTSGLHGIERVPGGWRGGADPRREGTRRGD